MCFVLYWEEMWNQIKTQLCLLSEHHIHGYYSMKTMTAANLMPSYCDDSFRKLWCPSCLKTDPVVYVMKVFNISVKSTIGGHVGICFKGSKGQAYIPDSKNRHRSNIQSHRSLHFSSKWTISPKYDICSYNRGQVVFFILIFK